MSDDREWVAGDALGLPIPADGAALREGGCAWLTRAMRAFGSLDAANRVTAIRRCDPFEGGGTGTKAVLSVAYETPRPDLHEDLFVKFSRNFADPIMDSARHHMEPEVRFAALSRAPGFPVAVPACAFADFHRESGTGLLITQRIAFGQGRVERQYPKCLDHRMPQPLDHYRVLVRTIGRLAGSHKAGRLPEQVASEFPFDRDAALAADRIRHDAQRLANRVARYGAFAADHPRLLPDAIRSAGFLAELRYGAELFRLHQDAIKRLLHAREDFIALCHWNANADNAWFWRDEAGELHCGLIDWGSVGQMHVAMTLWGCLSGAEHWLWRDHLDELLDLFVAAYREAGGPALDRAELRFHLLLYAAMMGLCWLMDAPPRILREVPDLAACSGPLDPRITASETARVQLQMMANFLCLWEAEGLTRLLRDRFGAACVASG